MKSGGSRVVLTLASAMSVAPDNLQDTQRGLGYSWRCATGVGTPKRRTLSVDRSSGYQAYAQKSSILT